MSCARHSSVFASCDACQAPFRREAERNATIADLRAKLAESERLCDEYQAAGHAALAEAERLRHGQQIEGDYVCPNELRAVNAEAEAKRLRCALEEAAAALDGAARWSPMGQAAAKAARAALSGATEEPNQSPHRQI